MQVIASQRGNMQYITNTALPWQMEASDNFGEIELSLDIVKDGEI